MQFPHLILSLIFLTTLSQSNGLCTLKHNGTLAQCHYLEDIKYIKTYELKSLRVTSVGKHLSSEVFGNLTSLQHLDFSHGKLRRIEPGTFAKLVNLRSIDLSNNHLTHLSRGTFEGPTHLRVLNLKKNSLVRIPIDVANLKDLKFLELSSNKLKCDCNTLKTRDELSSRGVFTSKKAICAGPGTLKGINLFEPDAEVICMFEKQDEDLEMQKDEAIDEGSGELGSGDSFDEIEPEDIPEDEKLISSEPQNSTSVSPPIEIPLSTIAASSKDDIFFSEDHNSNHSATKSPEETTTLSNSEIRKTPDVLIEGSGDDDLDDGSGLDSSEIPRVPPITWDNVPEVSEESTSDGVTPITTTTTTSGGWFDFVTGLLWSHEDTTTAAPPPTTTFKEFDPEDEGFFSVSSTTETPKKQVDEEILSPVLVAPVEGERNPHINETNAKVQDEPKNEESAAKQSKKGMGSYVVLGILLGVLGALIGVAAYKGNFCKKARKRNERRPDGNDAENGTEMKDLTKSLLENTNSVQPKVSSNGGKPEAMPLVSSSPSDDIKCDDEPTAKYVGAVSEPADPIKPPRKSFSPNEEAKKTNGTNGKVLGTSNDEQCPKVHGNLVNGKNDRDSLSSIGESPSSGTVSNPRNSNPSPGAQRVKITLQENPDSVPKTPLLITRTKAGDNLVKAP